MANMNLLVTVPAGGKVNIATFLPQPSGGPGNLKSNVMGNGNIYVQQMIIQNQGLNPCMIGDATTSATNGLQLSASGSANFGAFINYGSYLSDWWIYSALGTTIFILYIQ
jgi:hypothetical protein